MKRTALLLGGALALTSAWALAQDRPESLLPPGFDRPAPKAAPTRSPAPAPAPAPGAAKGESGGNSAPVVQRLPGASGAGSPASGGDAMARAIAANPSVKLPSLDVLAKMTPDELTDLLGLRPKFDIPAAARRSMKQVGVLAESEGGLPPGSLAGQNAALVRAALAGNKGALVSRWGHIMLRRALAYRQTGAPRSEQADSAELAGRFQQNIALGLTAHARASR